MCTHGRLELKSGSPYNVRRGYFGQGGRVYIPAWRAFLYYWFTDVAVYKGDEWLERRAR